MNEVMYVLAAIFGGFGLYIIVMNWCIFWVNCIKKTGHHSFGPLLGAVCLSIGFLAIPNNPYASVWWVACRH